MAKGIIEKELSLLAGMAAGWDGDAIPEIEKDIVLEKLRTLYETVKFSVSEPVQQVREPEAAAPVPDSVPEEEPARSRIDRSSAIMSLYGYESREEPARQPHNEWEYHPEPEPQPQHVAEPPKAAGLRGEIGVADELVVIRELFAGDHAAYEAELARLDGFEDLDQALIHIHDSHNWNPNGHGVQIIMDLLTRKFS